MGVGILANITSFMPIKKIKILARSVVRLFTLDVYFKFECHHVRVCML